MPNRGGVLSGLLSSLKPGSGFDYREINKALTAFLDLMPAERLFLLIDEWAVIPRTVQPYFAEHIKRSLFANNRVTVKIGVVDYAHQLNVQVGDHHIGLEHSSDVFSDVFMDRFFVWDVDSAFVEQFIGEVLFNHLALELPEQLAMDETAEKKHDFIAGLFTQQKVFSELCRASEGNIRDAIILFSKAYVKFAQQTTRQSIGLDEVIAAAVELYKLDKQQNITAEPALEEFLDHLVHDIIREKKSRTFMVPSKCRTHPVLLRLFRGRLLHPLDIEWSHPDKPGERYSLISMDFGTYITFKGTKNEPQQKVFWSKEEAAGQPDMVPLDDRRSIRRIVVTEETLDRFGAKLDKMPNNPPPKAP